MSTEPSQPIPISSPVPEPQVERKPVPIWLLILILLLIYWGMLYFDLHGGWFSQEVYAPYTSVEQVEYWQPKVGPVDLGRGKQVFESICGLCHNPDGAGKPNQGPPLAGSEWVQVENPAR